MKELRQDIIQELSCNPGHFAASLGTVELTVALHYVYNTPYDRIVWDVGHQAYGHKMLTGRREAFCTNRKFKGIRPFPTPVESDYDTFACGHASNSISAALGMAVAAAKKGEKDRHVVAVIGDGSMSGGLAFEGLEQRLIHQQQPVDYPQRQRHGDRPQCGWHETISLQPDYIEPLQPATLQSIQNAIQNGRTE